MKLNQVLSASTIPVVILLLMGFAGCKGGSKATSSPDTVPGDLKIIFGRMGTFGGRSMGYSISGNGDIVRWEGKYPEENIQANAKADTESVRRLWARAEEIGFLQLKYQDMTVVGSFINVTAGGESRRVVWGDQDDGVPTGVKEFYEECLEVARKTIMNDE